MNGAGTAPHVLIYRITGRQGAIRVPRWVCPECDLSVAAVRMALTQPASTVPRSRCAPG